MICPILKRLCQVFIVNLYRTQYLNPLYLFCLGPTIISVLVWIEMKDVETMSNFHPRSFLYNKDMFPLFSNAHVDQLYMYVSCIYYTIRQFHLPLSFFSIVSLYWGTGELRCFLLSPFYVLSLLIFPGMTVWFPRAAQLPPPFLLTSLLLITKILIYIYDVLTREMDLWRPLLPKSHARTFDLCIHNIENRVLRVISIYVYYSKIELSF